MTEVRVDGVRVVGEETAVGWTGIRVGQAWSERGDRVAVEGLLRGYRASGYWHARVEGPEVDVRDGGVAIRYGVDEGAQARVGSVTVAGRIGVEVGQVLAVIETDSGDVLAPASLAADGEALADFYERRGYPFVSVRPDAAVRPGETTVNVVWVVDAGPPVSIDGVRFSGARSTKDEILMRETGLKIGEPYDQRKVDDAARALRRLPWLASVAEPEIEADARTGRYVVHFAVEASPASTVEGGLGLLPGVDGAYSWVGRFQFASDNLGGSGRGAHFLWDRPDRSSSDLQMRYAEPWLLGKPFHGRIGIAFVHRPGYVEASVDGGVGYRPSRSTEVTATLGRASVRPDTVGGGAVSERQGVWSVGVEGRWDRRDDRRLPRRGWTVDGGVTWDRGGVSGVADGGFNRGRYRLDGRRYQPLGRRTTMAVRAVVSGLVQADAPGPEALLRVGGARSIRGYVEEHFLAEHAAWGSIGVNRDVGRGARAYAFADGGALRLPRGSGAGWTQAFGYGVGLQTGTRAGMMTVEYGLSKDDSPGQGKIHVRMLGQF